MAEAQGTGTGESAPTASGAAKPLYRRLGACWSLRAERRDRRQRQRDLIVALVREGRSRSGACRATGLHKSTLTKWVSRGKRDVEAAAHRAFLAALEAAEAARPRRRIAI